MDDVIKGLSEGLRLMAQGREAPPLDPGRPRHLGPPQAPRTRRTGGVRRRAGRLREDARSDPGARGRRRAVPRTPSEPRPAWPTSFSSAAKARTTRRPSSTVEVHYSGWTPDGKLFDSSVRRGKPTSFPLNGVIKGWTEGVQLMVVGDKARFWIPSALAYGDKPVAPGTPAGPAGLRHRAAVDPGNTVSYDLVVAARHRRAGARCATPSGWTICASGLTSSTDAWPEGGLPIWRAQRSVRTTDVDWQAGTLTIARSRAAVARRLRTGAPTGRGGRAARGRGPASKPTTSATSRSASCVDCTPPTGCASRRSPGRACWRR